MRVQGGVSAGSCSRRGACDEPSAAALFLETRCREEEAAMRDYYYAGRLLPATICWLRACGTQELARSMHSSALQGVCGVVCRSDRCGGVLLSLLAQPKMAFTK